MALRLFGRFIPALTAGDDCVESRCVWHFPPIIGRVGGALVNFPKGGRRFVLMPDYDEDTGHTIVFSKEYDFCSRIPSVIPIEQGRDLSTMALEPTAKHVAMFNYVGTEFKWQAAMSYMYELSLSTTPAAQIFHDALYRYFVDHPEVLPQGVQPIDLYSYRTLVRLRLLDGEDPLKIEEETLRH